MSGADAGVDAGLELGTTCEPFEVATCQYTSQCTRPLVCAGDGQCRNQCVTDIDCPSGQKCTSQSKLCADPTLDTNYDPATNEFKSLPGSGGSGGGGTSGSTGGNGGSGNGGSGTGVGGTGGSGAGGGTGGSDGGAPSDSGAAGSDGAAGIGGAAGAVTCPTTFGTMAQGDANAKFTSGVSVRNATTIFVFSGYVGPGPADGGAVTDAAPASGNYVYVQTFDAVSGNSLGAAQPLFQRVDGVSFGVNDVSVAPTGEIALLHSSGTTTDGFQTLLYATFLTTAPGDGGTGPGGLRVVRTVQLESVHEGEPHVIWSSASQTFVISWKYLGAQWFTRVRRFLPDGRATAGDISAVPTPTTQIFDPGTDDAQAASSGELLGVFYADSGGPDNNLPYLTILDADGLQVGSLIKLGSVSVGHWASVGGTTLGFVGVSYSGSTVNGAFVPIIGAGSVLADGGAPDGGDGGAIAPFRTFSFQATATTGKMVTDDTGGQGGVGLAILEANGVTFRYITPDASKQLAIGTVISSSTGAEIGLTNYLGSFAVSLYDSSVHATQVAVSGCGP